MQRMSETFSHFCSPRVRSLAGQQPLEALRREDLIPPHLCNYVSASSSSSSTHCPAAAFPAACTRCDAPAEPAPPPRAPAPRSPGLLPLDGQRAAWRRTSISKIQALSSVLLKCSCTCVHVALQQKVATLEIRLLWNLSLDSYM